MKTPKHTEMTVEAELEVVSPEGVEIIRRFDVAWARFRELPTPTTIRLTGFVRKDSVK